MLRVGEMFVKLAADSFSIEWLRHKNGISHKIPMKRSQFSRMFAKFNFSYNSTPESKTLVVISDHLNQRRVGRFQNWIAVLDYIFKIHEPGILLHSKELKPSIPFRFYLILTMFLFLPFSVFSHIIIFRKLFIFNLVPLVKSNTRFCFVLSMWVYLSSLSLIKKISILDKDCFIVGNFDVISHAVSFFYRSFGKSVCEVQHGVFASFHSLEELRFPALGWTLASKKYCWNHIELEKSCKAFSVVSHYVVGSPLELSLQVSPSVSLPNNLCDNCTLIVLQPLNVLDCDLLNLCIMKNCQSSQRFLVRCHPTEVVEYKVILRMFPALSGRIVMLSQADNIIDDFARVDKVISAWSSVNIDAAHFGIASIWSEPNRFPEYSSSILSSLFRA